VATIRRTCIAENVTICQESIFANQYNRTHVVSDVGKAVGSIGRSPWSGRPCVLCVGLQQTVVGWCMVRDVNVCQLLLSTKVNYSSGSYRPGPVNAQH